MNRTADKIVFLTVCFVAIGLTLQAVYQYGYDKARSECKPAPKVEIPLKNMTHKQAVRNIMWHNRDKGNIR